MAALADAPGNLAFTQSGMGCEWTGRRRTLRDGFVGTRGERRPPGGTYRRGIKRCEDGHRSYIKRDEELTVTGAVRVHKEREEDPPCPWIIF